MRSVRISIISIDDEHSKAIVSLRKGAFAEKFGASIQSSGLEWNQADRQSIHFGAYVGDRLVSAIRLTHVTTAEAFENQMLFPANHEFAVLPCMTLARAATSGDSRGLGLSMALRLAAYEHWCKEYPTCSYIFGTALSKSARLSKMKEWGYEFASNPRGWQGHHKSENQDVLVFRLSLSNLKTILPKLRSEIGTSQQA